MIENPPADELSYVSELNSLKGMSHDELAMFAARMLGRVAGRQLGDTRYWDEYDSMSEAEIRAILERADDALRAEERRREAYRVMAANNRQLARVETVACALSARLRSGSTSAALADSLSAATVRDELNCMSWDEFKALLEAGPHPDDLDDIASQLVHRVESRLSAEATEYIRGLGLSLCVNPDSLG